MIRTKCHNVGFVSYSDLPWSSCAAVFFPVSAFACCHSQSEVFAELNSATITGICIVLQWSLLKWMLAGLFFIACSPVQSEKCHFAGFRGPHTSFYSIYLYVGWKNDYYRNGAIVLPRKSLHINMISSKRGSWTQQWVFGDATGSDTGLLTDE